VNLLGAACALLATAIWGGVFVVSKLVLDFVPPVTLVAIRYAVALTVLWPLLAKRNAKGGHKRVTRADLPELAIIGVLGFGVSIVAQFAGTRLSTAANGALITTATPALVVLFAYLILGEPLSLRRGLGLALATFGVLVVADPRTAQLSPDLLLGNVLLAVAALTWALYSVLAKRAARRLSVLTVTTYAAVFGLLATAPLTPVELSIVGPPTDIPPLVGLGILYIGVVSTAGAFYLWNKGMTLLDSSAAAVLFFAQPVVGSLLGWLVLGETLGPAFFLGGALIVAGVAVVSSERGA
jgi:drug/metabolite transporter (DMT)-like permease